MLKLVSQGVGETPLEEAARALDAAAEKFAMVATCDPLSVGSAEASYLRSYSQFTAALRAATGMNVEDIADRIDGAGGQFAALNRAGIFAYPVERLLDQAAADRLAGAPFTRAQAWAAIAAVAALTVVAWWFL